MRKSLSQVIPPTSTLSQDGKILSFSHFFIGPQPGERRGRSPETGAGGWQVCMSALDSQVASRLCFLEPSDPEHFFSASAPNLHSGINV